MKITVFAAALLSAVSAIAQAPSDRGQVQKQLLQVEHDIATAQNTCDFDYFAKVEAEEFIFTDAQGGLTTRAEDLATAKDCKPKQDKHEFDDVRVMSFPATAVINARHTISGERNGKPFRVQTRLTDVFVWRDGRWQVVAGHSSRIPQKQP